MKLVMTLLVRDEADIVDAQIAFHLHAGVDFVIATDNLSEDGTTEILERYERAGAPAPDPREVARSAAGRMGDAHGPPRGHGVRGGLGAQLAMPTSSGGREVGRSRRCSRRSPSASASCAAAWRHFPPRPDDGGFFAERMTVRLRAPAHPGDKRTIFHAHQKVAHRARPGVLVELGNHDVRGGRLVPLRGWLPIEVLHFSLRSPEQLELKARGGWRDRTTIHKEDLIHAGNIGRLDEYWRSFRSTTRSSRAGCETDARDRYDAYATRSERCATTTETSGFLPATGGQLEFPRPHELDDAEFAASARLGDRRLVRAETAGRSRSRAPAQTRAGAARTACVDWRGGEGRHDAPRARRGGHRRRVARLPSERRRGLRRRDRQPLGGRHDRDPRALRTRGSRPPHPRAGRGPAPGRVGDANGPARRDGLRRRLGDQLGRGRVLVAAWDVAPRGARRGASSATGRSPRSCACSSRVRATARSPSG